ncbi:hypothetical protein ACQKWADRAFT_304366 [Trichoderma austrokoningii]
MSMYSHRGMGAVPPGNARLNELLEQIRAEFDNQQRQTESFEHQSTLPSHNSHCSRLIGVMLGRKGKISQLFFTKHQEGHKSKQKHHKLTCIYSLSAS